MAKVINLEKYKEKEKNRTKYFFKCDYKPSNDCCNDASYGTICVKCGKCGRKFSKRGFPK